MATISTKFAITLPDYERIFRIIHGVLLNEDCNPAHACLYFGVIGALILQKHHRMKAEPVVGMAAYRLNENVLAFATDDGISIGATPEGFHCWVEANGMALDFQAPLFKEAIAEQNPKIILPRNMMQKRLDQANPSLASLAHSGTHWYAPDQSLRSSLLANFIKMQANIDLIEICIAWYKPTPKKIPKAVEIANQRGQSSNVPMSQFRVDGVW